MQLQGGQGSRGGNDKDFQVVEEGLGLVSKDRQIRVNIEGDCKNRKDCSNKEGVEGEKQGEQYRKEEEEVKQ